MARHRAKISLLTAAILLAGCTTSRPPEVHKLHNEVGKLNQEVRQLTVQATALEMQNRLNTRASQGAWLLPTANTAVVLQSNVGELRLSLSNVEAEANGTRAILHIRSAGEQTLPALTAQIEWGELDASSDEPLSAASQSQTITLPSTDRKSVV